eukprot:SAG11_NODE_37814_length_255_cov_0.660256_1_plen_35_part_10
MNGGERTGARAAEQEARRAAEFAEEEGDDLDLAAN